jgi:hypothetical protein
MIPPETLESMESLGDDIEELNPDSPLQMAELLYDKLGVGRGQRIRTTKSGKRAALPARRNWKSGSGSTGNPSDYPLQAG